MLLEPNVMVFYVDDIAKSSQFYQTLLGATPAEASPTFHSFKLSTGMHLALKQKNTVIPTCDHKNGGSELAFILDDNKKVDELFTEWLRREINIILKPSILPFGYSFVATDPDGNRLRVVSLGK